MTRLLRIIAAATAGYVLFIRPWHLRWGASEAEAQGPLPGDHLVSEPRLQTTRAIDIAAPAECVWPWLIQMGTGRAGWYSYDVLENLLGLQVESKHEILPELQLLEVGDVIPAAPPPYLGFLVREIDRPRTLVTSASIDLITGQTIEPHAAQAGRRLDSSWTFVLQPGDGDGCRLIARLRIAYEPSLLNDVAVRAVLEPAHFLMERRMLQGIKQRAESGGAGAAEPPSTRSR